MHNGPASKFLPFTVPARGATMADRRLQRVAQRASQAQDAAPSEIDSLLAAMGGSAVRAAHAPFGPAMSGVGEEVWEPGVHPARLPSAGAGADPVPAPSVPLELRRRKAMRQLQAVHSLC